MVFYGLIEPYRLNQDLQGPLTSEEYLTFSSNVTSRKLNLRSFLRQEYTYDKAAKDLVYKEGPMMVNIPLYPRVTTQGRRDWFEQTKDFVSIPNEDTERLKLLEWLKGDPENTDVPTRSIIEDDPWIIRDVSKLKIVQAAAVVTNDRKLCIEAHQTTRRVVCRVPVKWYYMALYFTGEEDPWLEILKHNYPMYDWVTILDTGSIESFEETNFRDGVPMKNTQEQPLVMTKVAISAKGSRIRARKTPAESEEDYEWKPFRFPENYTLGIKAIQSRRPAVGRLRGPAGAMS